MGSFFLFSCEHPDKVFQHFSLRVNANVQPINPKRNVKKIGGFTSGVFMQSFVINNIIGDGGRNALVVIEILVYNANNKGAVLKTMKMNIKGAKICVIVNSKMIRTV